MEDDNNETPASPKLAHRDDVDLEDMEKLEELFADLYPGMKVVFAGDMPEDEVPQCVIDSATRIEAHHLRSVRLGRCVDCDAQMPGFAPEDDDWWLPEGWQFFDGPLGPGMGGFLCPICDEIDERNPGPKIIDLRDRLVSETEDPEPQDE